MAACHADPEDLELGRRSPNSLVRSLAWTKTLAWTEGSGFEAYASSRSWVFSPEHPLLHTEQIFVMIIILLCLWNDTVEMAMLSSFPDPQILGSAWEPFLLTVLSLDMLVQFNIGYTKINEDRDVWVTDRCKIAKRYLTSWFAFDLITMFPWEWFMSGLGSISSLRFLKAGKILRVLRAVSLVFRSHALTNLMLRLDDWIAEVCGSSEVLESLVLVGRCMSGVIGFASILFLEAHFLACLLLGCDVKIVSGDLGVDEVGDQLPDAIDMYLVAVCWAAAALVTGTVDSSTLSKAAFSRSIMFIHWMVPFVFSANLMAALYIAGYTMHVELDGDFQMKIKCLKHFLRKHEVATTTRNNVIEYALMTRHTKSFDAFNEILGCVPSGTRKQLHASLFRAMMDGFRLFQQGPFCDDGDGNQASIVLELCIEVESTALIKGETIAKVGLPYEAMYYLMAGRIAAVDHDGEPENRACTSSVHQLATKYHGVEALWAPAKMRYQLATATLIAQGNTECALLRRERFESVVSKRPDWNHFVHFVRESVESGKVGAASLVEKGLEPELQCRWERAWRSHEESRRQEAISSEDLGVSLKWLVGEFVAEVARAVNRPDDEQLLNLTFSDLRQEFWPMEQGPRETVHSPPMARDPPGFMGCQEKACPRDGITGCAVVDALGEMHKSRATHFVSWCWQYSLETVTSSLRDWAESVDNVESTFLWMCFFCNNQRKMLLSSQNQSTEVLASNFESRLRSIGRMVIILDGFIDPAYTKRIWTVFEVFQAETIGIEAEVTLPGSSKSDLHHQLMSNEFGTLLKNLTAINAKEAKSSVPRDEATIKRMIEENIGFDRVNLAVKHALSKWLSATLNEILLAHIHSQPEHAAPTLVLSTPCSRLHSKSRRPRTSSMYAAGGPLEQTQQRLADYPRSCPLGRMVAEERIGSKGAAAGDSQRHSLLARQNFDEQEPPVLRSIALGASEPTTPELQSRAGSVPANQPAARSESGCHSASNSAGSAPIGQFFGPDAPWKELN